MTMAAFDDIIRKLEAAKGDVQEQAVIRDAPEDWRTLSSRAAAWFDGCREPAARIQRVYHLLSADPDSGARCLEDLDREWTGAGRLEDRQALALAVGELETTGLVDGAARVEVVLCTAEVRSSRGETAQLGEQAREAESLARQIQHWPGLGRTFCLLGDVLQARGDLAGAEAAFGEYLMNRRRLAQQDPSNAEWQHGLAVTLAEIGRLRVGGGKGREAVPFLREAKAIFETLVALTPSHTGWKAELEAVVWELVVAEILTRDV